MPFFSTLYSSKNAGKNASVSTKITVLSLIKIMFLDFLVSSEGSCDTENSPTQLNSQA